MRYLTSGFWSRLPSHKVLIRSDLILVQPFAEKGILKSDDPRSPLITSPTSFPFFCLHRSLSGAECNPLFSIPPYPSHCAFSCVRSSPVPSHPAHLLGLCPPFGPPFVHPACAVPYPALIILDRSAHPPAAISTLTQPSLVHPLFVELWQSRRQRFRRHLSQCSFFFILDSILLGPCVFPFPGSYGVFFYFSLTPGGSVFSARHLDLLPWAAPARD